MPEPKNVLIVVDAFPASGGGRIDKFIKYLPQFGLRPIVLSAKETDSPYRQQIKERYYPGDLKACHAKSIGWALFSDRFLMRGKDAKYYNLLKVLSFPERFFLIPDHMARWVPFGVCCARRLIQDEKIGVVLTSSPPESTHLIGMLLKHHLAIRWVADFRDLWIEKKLYRPPTNLHNRINERLEKQIFEKADSVIANTPENADRYLQRFPFAKDKISIIPNGFDREDLSAFVKNTNPEKFRIGYSGALDKHAFPWRIALQAIKQLAEEVGNDRVRFVHCGYLSKQVISFLEQEDMASLVEIHGQLPHEDAIKLTAQSDIRLLLLYENEYSASIVPLKLYNYLIMNGPVLAIAPENGRTASIIRDTNMGSIISPTRGVETVFQALLKYFRDWERNLLSVEPNEQELRRYDRRSQTETLAKVLQAS